MNWKFTAALVVVAVAIGAIVYFNPFAGEEERAPKDPWFYQVSFDDIIHIKVQSGDNVESFTKIGEGSWVFDRLEGIPPSHLRWGGIVLLLSGPQTSRDDIRVERRTIDDPAQYGLDDPGLIVNLGLTGDRDLEFRLGHKTVDGNSSYGQVIGFPQLFLIADIWGDVLGRLANEPPVPKWWEIRDPETIAEVNIVLGTPGKMDPPYLRIQQKDGEWFARHFTSDVDNRPLDEEVWASEYIHLIGGPGNIKVAEYRVRDRDYVDWGIDQDGLSIEIRFSGLTERGTRYTDGVLFLIGNKTEDGKHYYAVPASDQTLVPIILIDAEWADTMFNLVDNVPYAAEAAAQSG